MARTPELKPPNELSRAEKREFRRVIAARSAENRPVQAAELRTLCDFVESRTRLADLNMIAKRNRSPTMWGDYVGLLRQIDNTTKLSRQLAVDLGLVSVVAPGKKAAAARRADQPSGDGWDTLIGPDA